MHDKNNGTKSFTQLGKYLLNGFLLTILLKAISRTQPKVYGRAVELFSKIVNNIWLLTFIT